SALAVPVPTTVSPELQAILRMGNIARTPPPLPTTNEGWYLRRGEPAERKRRIEELLTRFGVSMTKRVISGVPCFVLTPANLAAHRADDMVLFGTSAGGALVLSMVQRARAQSLPLPAAVVAGTP